MVRARNRYRALGSVLMVIKSRSDLTAFKAALSIGKELAAILSCAKGLRLLKLLINMQLARRQFFWSDVLL